MDKKKTRHLLRGSLILASLLLLFPSQQVRAYSFLTHESIIDLAWEPAIKPLLLKRYPHTTPAQLKVAHGYAYGGSTIQDAGYYPSGNAFFSNLAHYVRTGAFVDALLHDSQNVYEFAFALGAMSHYVGDAIGHSYAINPSVAIEFPSLKKRYGKIVTYEDNPHDHVRTEFAFDIDQLAHHRFAPPSYLRSVGMYVPIRLMNQAFFETYGLPLRSVIGNEFVAFRGYRTSVRQFLTRVAYAEVLLHRKHMPPDLNTSEFRKFKARLHVADTQNHWERYRRHRIGFATRFYAFLIVILPKIGPLADLAIRGPNVKTEQKYIYSVDDAVDEYDYLLNEIRKDGLKNFYLPNIDLDTGYPTRPGAYALTDKTYAKLLHRITRSRRSTHIPYQLKHSILAYFSNPKAPDTLKKFPRKWRRVQADLTVLRRTPALPAHIAYVENSSRTQSGKQISRHNVQSQ